jgi:hypothetical protein
MTFLLYTNRIWANFNPIGSDIPKELFIETANRNYLALMGGWMNWSDYTTYFFMLIVSLITCPKITNRKDFGLPKSAF